MYSCSMSTCRQPAQHCCFECEEDFCKNHAKQCTTCGNFFCQNDNCQHLTKKCQEIRALAAQGQKLKPRRSLPTPPEPQASRRKLPSLPTTLSPLLANTHHPCLVCRQNTPNDELHNKLCLTCSTINTFMLDEQKCNHCERKPAYKERFCAMCLAGYKRMHKDPRPLHVALSHLKVNKAITPGFFQLNSLSVINKKDETDYSAYYLEQVLSLELFLHPYRDVSSGTRTSRIFLPPSLKEPSVMDDSQILMALYQTYQGYFSGQRVDGDLNTLLEQQKFLIPRLVTAPLLADITSLLNKPNLVINHTINNLTKERFLPAAHVQEPQFRANHARMLAFTLLLQLNQAQLPKDLQALLKECRNYIVLSYSPMLYSNSAMTIQPLSYLTLKLNR